MKEIWKPIKKFPDYSVSSFGRIKRVTSSPGAVVGKLLCSKKDKDGYHCLVLRKNKKSHSLRVHRIVATIFIGNPPSNKHEINHLNGIQSDNNYINLEWSTSRKNTQHAIKNGLRLKKLNAEGIQFILEYPKYHGSGVFLSKKFNVSDSTISNVRIKN